MSLNVIYFQRFSSCRYDITNDRDIDKRGRSYKLRLYFQSLSKTVSMVDRGSGRNCLTFWHKQKVFQTLSQVPTIFCGSQN